ncbi:hypothetical protein EW093_04015 [Thiospirochaeta perfilievii]|uniref:histidine kinase n=1 Tax=Thiospirochaeta perfilievii TaxID=252967 RepID=A0A5C1QAE8_9SPIO|nr:histidine kinase N-terminal 7TM domain-containing protein [Thiospirochaeta perfilievii]QEN03899.1 hypothetical protein EW093_04015 [Thiospirochaeta perfilievii]
MDYVLYQFLAPLVAGFNILSILISFRYLKERISKIVLMFQLAALILLILEYMEFYLNNEYQMVFVIKLGHVVMQFYAVLWFIFCLNYTGYEKIINKRFITIIFAFILFNTFVVFTNDLHHQFYHNVSFLYKGGYSTIMAEYGFYFWIICSFNYIFIITGVIFIIVSYIRGGSYYRSQAQFIIIGYIVSLLVNIIYIFRLLPDFTKDFSAVTFAIISLCTFIGTYRFRILHYSPLSRNLVLQNMDDAIITLDLDYRIIDYNIKATRLFNLSERDLGQRVERGFLGTITGNVSTFFLNKDYVSFIKKIMDKSYNLNIRRLYDKQSDSKGIVLTFSDISDKIKLIDELDCSSKKIDNMQSFLVRSEKMAALGQLSAEISHEINNPLTYIKSNCHILQRYLDEDTFNNNIEDIKELVKDTNFGIQRISEVIKNMLSYTREDREDSEILYDINKGVESTLILARSVIRNRAELKLDLGCNIPKIKILGNKVDQVVLNLLVNSAHAIEEHRTDGIIKVSTYVNDCNIICDIYDNGIPINIEDRELLFEPFYTSTSTNNGTGLGLTLSRKIIESEFHGRLYIVDSIEKYFV